MQRKKIKMPGIIKKVDFKKGIGIKQSTVTLLATYWGELEPVEIDWDDLREYIRKNASPRLIHNTGGSITAINNITGTWHMMSEEHKVICQPILERHLTRLLKIRDEIIDSPPPYK